VSSAQVEALIRLYRNALILLAISFGISVLGVVANYFQYGDNISFLQLFLTMGVFSPAVSFAGELIALPGMLFLYRSALKLRGLDENQQKTQYLKIWGFQQTVGTLVSVGAVIMIPGSGMALQGGVAGLSIVFPIFAGAFIHLKARAINRDINYVKPYAVGELDYRPEKKQNDATPATAADKSGGMASLIVAALVLVLNVIFEAILFLELRDNPSFDFQTGVLPYPTSMTVGFNQVFDLFVLSTIGIAFLVLAIVARARTPKRRLRAIVIMTVLGLVIFPGTIAVKLAQALGPSSIALEGKENIKDSLSTLQVLNNSELPAGFEMINEFYQGEPDSSLRTGVYNLDEPEITSTCQEVVTYVIAKGATQYRASDSGSLQPIAGPDALVETCGTTLGTYPVLKVQRLEVFSEPIYFYGPSSFEANGAIGVPMSYKLTLIKYGSEWERPYSWGYEFMISTTFAQDINAVLDGLDKPTVEINDLLLHVAQERLANPDKNPTDPTFMAQILATFKHKISIELFEPHPGVAEWLDVKTSDGHQICLSVRPWNETNEGMEDPGFGYSLGFQEDFKSLDEYGGYGIAVEGTCQLP
jgi:hypothetical protein